MRVRSMVGLIPMLAVEVIDPKLINGAAGVRRAGCAGSCATGRTWPS